MAIANGRNQYFDQFDSHEVDSSDKTDNLKKNQVQTFIYIRNKSIRK